MDPSEPLDDAALLAAASRDPGAFRQLYDRHGDAVHAFALRRVADADAALEVTAETFARAWYARRRFRGHRSGSALPWLYGIAANVLRESARRRRMANEATVRLGVVLGVDRPDPLPDGSWGIGLDEEIERALMALPAPQREAVSLRHLDDRSYEAIASIAGCSEGAARIRVSRGLAGIRRRLEESSDGTT